MANAKKKVSVRAPQQWKFPQNPACRALPCWTKRVRCGRPWRNFCSIPRARKLCTTRNLVELLEGPVAGIRHATMLYSYLLRPTTSKHTLADAVLRQENVNLTGAPGEHAEHMQRLAPLLRKEVEAQGLAKVYETIDLPLAPVLAEMERHGVRVDRTELAAMSETMEREIRALEKIIWEHAGSEFNVNSPLQLAEVLFDKMGLQLGGRRQRKTALHRRGRFGRISVAARNAAQGSGISRA